MAWHRVATLMMAGLALGVMALAPGAARDAPKPYPGPLTEGDPALFGDWTFAVQSLAHTETAIAPITSEVTVCLKHGVKPAELPLMAVPLQGRCVMQRMEIKAEHISVLMLCEDFDRRTSLSAYLQPKKDGSYGGEFSFTMTLDDAGHGTMHANAEVTARRRGDC